MKRQFSILFAVLALMAAPAAFGFSDYLSGSVSISRAGLRSTAVYSAGSEICYTYFGNVDYNCLISVGHSVVSSSGAYPPGANGPNPVSTFVYGEYAGNVRAYGDEGECYRGQLSVSASAPTGPLSDYHGSNQVCVIIYEPPPPPDPGCPIVLNLDLKGGYDLTGLNDPVAFDIDADGRNDLLGWTAREANEGFLVLDRNGNGLIDNGTELFGYATPLADGQNAGVGFDALAEFDDPLHGGNGDGTIGPEDAAWKNLRVWIDRNHDGLSTPDELQTLDQAGVVRLGFDYRLTNRTDPNGNVFRYRSYGWFKGPGGHTRMAPVYDVIFIH